MNESININDHILEIVEKYTDMLIKICYLNLKNMSDAEDVVQDVFLRVLKYKPIFENENHEKAWLIKVAINLCRDRVKSSWFRKRVQFDNDLYNMDTEKRELILDVMNLPLKYRNVIILFYYNNYSINDIAQITGQKKVTIGSQLQRARKLLKIQLNGEDNDEC